MHDYLATEANEGAGALSPDGKWIAYWSDASGTPDLVVDSFPMPSGARRFQALTSTSAVSSLYNNRLWWDADGRSVLYPHFDAAVVELRSIDVRLQPVLVLENPRSLMELPADMYGVDYDVPRRRMLLAAPVGTPRSSLVVLQNWQRQLEAAN
jgi:hypothetical protein